MMRRAIFAVLALAAVASSFAPVAGAAQGAATTSVIDGQEAAVGTFPFMAFVSFYNGVEGDLCSGTLVSSNVVLTAAHCVFNEDFTVLRNPANLTVVTGDVDWASPSRTISTAIRVAVDPDLRWSIPSLVPVRGDAALIELASPVTAPPVALATSRRWTTGTGAVMAGWGRVAPGGASVETLRVGETVVQSPEYCEAKASHFESAWVLCAQDYPGARYSTCQGDSGGPLLITGPAGEATEIGVTSYGLEACSPSLPQYFTRADAIAPWVAQKVGEWAPPAPVPATTTTAPPTPRATPSPAPAPSAPTLPVMSRPQAAAYATGALRRRLWAQFRGHSRLRVSCTSTATPRQRCDVGWSQGEKSYWGTVTVFYLLEGANVVWSDRYRIQTIVSCDPRCSRKTFTG